MEPTNVIITLGIAILIIVILASTVKIIPQRSAFIVERLGKYNATLQAGFQILVPFIDKISYKHTLKEQAIDVASQICITKDNISVEVDGILYLQVIDPKKASYGIDDYRFASIQIAQTTMRSIIGKLELDKTFEERDTINVSIVEAVDKASDPWGVKINRVELKNIIPPKEIREAMEKQMRAERERRESILIAEGKKAANILEAEGKKEAAIREAEGKREASIREAEGRAQAILNVQTAVAKGIELVKAAKADKAVLTLEAYKAMENVANGQATKIIIPSEMQGVVGLASGLAEALKDPK